MTVTDSEKHFAALSEIGENVQSVIYNLMFLVSAGKDWNLDGNVASAMYCAINYLTMLHSQLEDETAALFALSKEGKA